MLARSRRSVVSESVVDAGDAVTVSPRLTRAAGRLTHRGGRDRGRVDHGLDVVLRSGTPTGRKHLHRDLRRGTATNGSL